MVILVLKYSQQVASYRKLEIFLITPVFLQSENSYLILSCMFKSDLGGQRVFDLNQFWLCFFFVVCEVNLGILDRAPLMYLGELKHPLQVWLNGWLSLQKVGWFHWVLLFFNCISVTFNYKLLNWFALTVDLHLTF